MLLLLCAILKRKGVSLLVGTVCITESVLIYGYCKPEPNYTAETVDKKIVFFFVLGDTDEYIII